MSDNKFEEQVRQKMNELKITPSSGTWEKIEAGFRSQRRRRFTIWLPALLLLVAGGGYFAYQALDDQPASLAGPTAGAGRQTTATINDAVEGPSAERALKPAAGSDRDQPAGPDKINQKENARSGDRLFVPDARATRSIAKKGTNGNEQSLQKALLTGPSPARRGKLSDPQDNERVKDGSSSVSRGQQARSDEPARSRPNQDDTKSTEKEPSVERIAGIKENEKENEADEQENKKNEVASLKDLDDAPVRNDEKQAPAVAADKNKRAARSWQWGINANAGMAFVREGNGLDFGQTMMDDLSVLSSPGMMGPSFAPSPPSMVPGPSFAPSTPSAIRPGLAFTIGGMVKRNFSDRISVSASLSYAQYNTHTQVGERIERNQIVNSGVMGYQNVGAYFLNTQTQDYSNRYHFIDLPLTLHVKLNRSEKTPFYLNAGGYLSRLISSNSLHFDGSNAVYYRNDDFLNKTQAGASAGLSMVLFNRSAMPLWVGPSLRYGFSHLLKKDVSVNKRLAMPSIDIKLFFNK